MAIAFDAASDGGRATAASQTWSHVCTGADLILFVGVLNGAVQTITSVTYNGVACTQIGTDMINNAANYRLTSWYVVAPATGSHSVVVTPSAASDTMALAGSYTGVLQTGFPDASGSRQPAQAASVTETLTTVLDNCWLAWVGLDEFGTGETAGAGTTLRWASSGYGGVFLADSNGARTPAGSQSLVMNASNPADWMNDQFWSFGPAGGGGGGGQPMATRGHQVPAQDQGGSLVPRGGGRIFGYRKAA